MYKRLIILTMIIAAALCGLTLLGYHAVEKWGEGLEGKRLGEFAEVAEQIRLDVKRKLDEFIETEENRPYTHYQYWYVPESAAADQQQLSLLRSPLAGRTENRLAIANFQIEPDGNIITANDDIVEKEGETEYNTKLSAQVEWHRNNVSNYLLPVLNVATSEPLKKDIHKKAAALASAPSKPSKTLQEAEVATRDTQDKKGKGFRRQRGDYPIESLQSREQRTQVVQQQRAVYDKTLSSNVARAGRERQSLDRRAEAPTELGVTEQVKETTEKGLLAAEQDSEAGRLERMKETKAARRLSARGQAAETEKAEFAGQREESLKAMRFDVADVDKDTYAAQQLAEVDEAQRGWYWDAKNGRRSAYEARLRMETQEDQGEMVQVRVGGFRTIVTNGENAEQSIFGGQVFLVRDVQIEDRHISQGFQLNEKKLIEEVRESAERFMREGMGFELSRIENENVAYAATLDFVFGDLVLNLKEEDPGRIVKQISQLQNWYSSIIAIVLLAVTFGLASLWRNARAQLKLAEKKDDFISAVSHELRTPLTSIRMYSEMLERNWVKSEDKLGEYYRSMRQESERLSRLIENVLDFSRIQKGRKKYTFSVGDLNECIADVVEMMSPYAAQNGFSIQTELEQPGQAAFDSDAVKQIVVNLLDNAIKYARGAKDKTITVRSKSEGEFILIEVEDHGPGIPHRQRKKIFEEFYRLGSEATRETTGTGLGLALVKKFAQAHNGFVDILAAKPTGAIFRVGLTAGL